MAFQVRLARAEPLTAHNRCRRDGTVCSAGAAARRDRNLAERHASTPPPSRTANTSDRIGRQAAEMATRSTCIAGSERRRLGERSRFAGRSSNGARNFGCKNRIGGRRRRRFRHEEHAGVRGLDERVQGAADPPADEIADDRAPNRLRCDDPNANGAILRRRRENRKG